MSSKTNAELVGGMFRMMRAELGLTLAEVGALADVSSAHLSRVESGKRAASEPLKDRLCDVFAQTLGKAAQR